MKENKKENGCERNFNGRFSGELGWEIVQQFTSEEPMNCFRELLLTGSEYVHKLITQLPKDYYLIPGKLHHKTCSPLL